MWSSGVVVRSYATWAQKQECAIFNALHRPIHCVVWSADSGDSIPIALQLRPLVATVTRCCRGHRLTSARPQYEHLCWTTAPRPNLRTHPTSRHHGLVTCRVQTLVATRLLAVIFTCSALSKVFITSIATMTFEKTTTFSTECRGD